MPPKYLENILLQMRRAGLVRGQRGPEGGYVLARPAAEISLADVIRAVDGPLANVRGERPEHVGYRGPAESLQQVWIALRANEAPSWRRSRWTRWPAEHSPTASASSPPTPPPGTDPRTRQARRLGLTHTTRRLPAWA